MGLLRAVPLMLTVLVTSAPATGQDVRQSTASVQARQEVLLTRHSSPGPNCDGAELPRITIVKPPEHGQVEVRPTTERINNASSPCNGRTVPATGVFYRAGAGGRVDTVTYDRLNLDGRPLFRVQFTITIRG